MWFWVLLTIIKLEGIELVDIQVSTEIKYNTIFNYGSYLSNRSYKFFIIGTDIMNHPPLAIYKFEAVEVNGLKGKNKKEKLL